jgi:iron complex transport system substrate-binding protein
MVFNSKFRIQNLKFRWASTALFLFITLFSQVLARDKATSPHRVISLSPNFTEIIYDIGAQDQLVGVTSFCKFPPEAQQKEKVGGWVNPNIEKIISLKPDLLLVPKFIGGGGDRLAKLHLPVLVLNWATVQDVLELYDVIGEKLGHVREAQKAKARLQGNLNRLKGRKSIGAPLSVLFIVDHTPGTLQQLYGVGSRNFIDELIQWTGGRNVLEDSPLEYPLVSKEQIVRRDPDVIITVLPPQTKPNEEKADLDTWKQLPSLKAVKRGHVYSFQGDDLMVPGPTMFHLAKLLSDSFAKVRAWHE